jgi:hypothetical protein
VGAQLQVLANIDFETTPSITVTATVTDNGSPALSLTQSFVITVVRGGGGVPLPCRGVERAWEGAVLVPECPALSLCPPTSSFLSRSGRPGTAPSLPFGLRAPTLLHFTTWWSELETLHVPAPMCRPMSMSRPRPSHCP